MHLFLAAVLAVPTLPGDAQLPNALQLVANMPDPVRAEQRDIIPGSHTNNHVAYVIASPERFNDGRVHALRDMLQYTFVRADPVWSNNTGCGTAATNEEDRKAYGHVRGTFLAHRNTWSAIALSATLSRALVIESDFVVGNRTALWLRERMDAAWDRSDEDYTSVGWCDMCPTSPLSPCYSCATAYLMHPRYAAMLTRADVCVADDAMMIGGCAINGGQHGVPEEWIIDLQRQVGIDANHTVHCSFLYEDPISMGDNAKFRGVFQQDVEHFAGSHWGQNVIDQPAMVARASTMA